MIRVSAKSSVNAAVLVAAVACAVLALLIAPVRFGDRRVYVVEGRDLDATQGCLLTAAGIDRLLARPRSFYDTAILYPDRHQLRSTEPFLGYALLGLPLRVFLRLNEVDLFEVLRWVILFTSLIYAYFLFRMLGVAPALALAGAALCLSQPSLINEIERLQVLCVPLLFPVLYHALALWKSDRQPLSRAGVAHSAALFLFTALYPLCGAINATIATLAALCAFPLILAMAIDLGRQKRLAAVLVPVGGAVVVDAIALAPWLLDRSDLKPYLTDAFLAVKHWNPTNLPLRLRHIVPFLGARAGWSLIAAGIVLAAAAAQRAMVTRRDGTAGGVQNWLRSEQHLLVLLVPALAMLAAAARGITRQTVPWLGLLLDLSCAATLLLNWRVQFRPPAVKEDSFARYLAAASAGLAVFLGFISFGPVYASNGHPLATNLTSVAFFVLPPLKAIREYDRIWIFAMLFLSMYLTVRLATAMKDSRGLVRGAAAVFVTVPLLVALRQRPVVASAPIEAPKEFLAAAQHSGARGPIYVHPVMKWNSRSGVLMIAIARDLGRPIVNGCLGICPPWFIYATNVLHRFPDPEALWLLRQWNVETIVGVTGDVVGRRVDGLVKVYENNQGQVVWELGPGRDTWHPSAPDNAGIIEAPDRADAEWAQTGDRAGAGTLSASTPAGFMTQAVEVQFAPSIVQPIPDAISIFAVEGGRRIRMNRDRAGDWIESLAADALLRRESPRALIALNAPLQGRFEVECRNTVNPPVERIRLIGRREHGLF